MIAPLLLLFVAEATPIDSKIVDVTLYGTSALVHRTAHVGASGSFVLSGLTQALDPDNVFILDSYANFLFAQGRFEDAIAQWQAEIRLAPDNGRAVFADAGREQVQIDHRGTRSAVSAGGRCRLGPVGESLPHPGEYLVPSAGHR